MSDIEITCIQWGGASFRNIGLPPAPEYKDKTQRPLSFKNCDINGSTFRNCNLRNVKISGCNLEGMTINEISVQDLLSVYDDQSLHPTKKLALSGG
jgi:uncharacterized protein YjbI with pentapeptide repeats